MSVKPFDIIIFGATGHVGRCVTKYIHYLSPSIKWAIAGRNHGKLAAIKSELMEMKVTTSSPQYALPDILIGDVTDTIGLKEMFSTCKLVLNCTGPYRFLGLDIVEACIKARCDYMDVSGEPVFMEQSFLAWHERAAASGVLILHSCGFDSVPADLGCLFTMQQYPPQMCSSIESYMIIRCPAGLSAHYTAFESAVHDAGDTSILKQVRNDIKEKFKPPQLMEIGPKIKKRPAYYYDKRVKKYTLPFSGTDISVVRSTQRTMAMLEGQLIWPQYQGYVAISSIYNVAATSFYGSLCNSLAGSSIGRSLLLSFPEMASGGVITHSGPSAKQLEKTTFEIHLYGKGYSTYMPELAGLLINQTTAATTSSAGGTSSDKQKDREGLEKDKEKEKESYAREPILATDVQQTSVLSKSCAPTFFDYPFKSSSSIQSPAPAPPTDRDVHIVVSGPEPAYLATPMILVTLALCLLEERDTMSIGGVFTPAAAFHKSLTVIDRLDQAGIMFTIHETSMQGEADQFLNELMVTNVEADDEEDGHGDREKDHHQEESALQSMISCQPAAELMEHLVPDMTTNDVKVPSSSVLDALDISVAITDDDVNQPTCGMNDAVSAIEVHTCTRSDDGINMEDKQHPVNDFSMDGLDAMISEILSDTVTKVDSSANQSSSI